MGSNILCVIDNLGSGGAQRQLSELALGFKERGHMVSFLTYEHHPFFNSYIENEGIQIHCIPEKSYVRRLLKLRRYIRQGNYDAVLSFLEGPSFICEYAGLPFRKWKLIVGERNADQRILKSLRLILYRYFHLFADYVVANSKANLQLVRKINPLLPERKCEVIYNIVDFNKWRPSESYLPRKEGILRIVVAASHQRHKNLNGLIDALELMPLVEREKFRIDWYGHRLTEPYIDDSVIIGRKRIADLNLGATIVLHPTTDDLRKVIEDADAVGLFSFREGLPNVVCEGMSCAKPIICSAVSDTPEFLSHDRKLLCDPSNPESIREALLYLSSLDNDRLIEIGRINERTARENFGRDSKITQYLNLLTDEKQGK